MGLSFFDVQKNAKQVTAYLSNHNQGKRFFFFRWKPTFFSFASVVVRSRRTLGWRKWESPETTEEGFQSIQGKLKFLFDFPFTGRIFL
jgi:hypothetical protein